VTELTEDTKPKKAKKAKPEESASDIKLAALTEALKIPFAHYAKTHKMKTPDDFSYPGFKEIFWILNS
jgi:hypothetical protein